MIHWNFDLKLKVESINMTLLIVIVGDAITVFVKCVSQQT